MAENPADLTPKGGLSAAMAALAPEEAAWLVRVLGDPAARAAAVDDYHARSALCRLLTDAAQRRDAAMDTDVGNVPQIIMQYWDQGRPSADVAALMEGWRSAHPGWDWRLFDAGSARAFLSEHCAAEAVAAFDRCTHPVMRCDLFRLLHVHAVGGVYIDADEECLAPLGNLAGGAELAIAARAWLHAEEREIAPDEALASGYDAGAVAYYVNNAPLCAVARHPMLGAFATHVVARLLASPDVPRVDALTAPQHFTRALLAWMLDDDGLIARAGTVRILPRWYGAYAREHWLDYKNTALNWRN